MTAEGKSGAAVAINKPRVEKEPSPEITVLSQITSSPRSLPPFSHFFSNLEILYILGFCFSTRTSEALLVIKRLAGIFIT